MRIADLIPRGRLPLIVPTAAVVGLLATTTSPFNNQSVTGSPCIASYQVLERQADYVRAAVEVYNAGETTASWKLEFDLPEGYTVQQSTQVPFSQSGTSVEVGDPSLGALAAGMSVRSQFQISLAGDTPGSPGQFLLNNQACDNVSLPDSSSISASTEPEPALVVEVPAGPETASMATAEDTITTLPPQTRPSASGNIELIRANPTRNTQFDSNTYRDVPMADIPLSDLTVKGDIYDEVLLDTTNSGYFRFKCEISHFAYDDPILYPDQPGRAHLHMFFGNTEANAFSTFDSLLNTGTGSCNGEDLNRSAYWIPALLDPDGNALIPFEVMVYYKNDNFRHNGANELVQPLPDNLRMIAGQGNAISPQSERTGDHNSLPVVSFACGPAYNTTDLQPLIPDCDGTGAGPYSGRALEMKIAFPQCHNPDKGTYQADGSHMSYSDGGYYGARCPDSHPYDITSVMYRVFFDPDAYGGSLRGLSLSSDVKPDAVLPGGTTAHADWFGAWHPEAMNMWVDNCNNTRADCEIGLLDRDPAISMVERKTGFYPSGYRAMAEDLIKLCPGKDLDPNDRLRSIASCHHS